VNDLRAGARSRPPARGLRDPFPAQRVAWTVTACALLLASLWYGPASLLGAQVNTRLLQPIAGPSSSAGQPAARSAEVRAPGLRVGFDPRTGRIALRWLSGSGATVASLSGEAGVLLRGVTGSGQAGELLASDYAHHTVALTSGAGPLGSGTQVTYTHTDARYPTMRQTVFVSATSGAVVLRTEIGAAHGPFLEADRIDPLVVAGRDAMALPTAGHTLVFTANGATDDHMPRLFTALDALPDYAAVPYVTAIAAPGGALLAGALSATSWFPSVQLSHGPGGLQGISLGEAGPVGGSLLAAEPFLIGRYPSAQTALGAYARAVAGIQPPLPAARQAQLGWSSWGAYELAVTDQRVRRNVDFMAAHLRDLGYTTIHIDDGWEQRYGDWLPGASFPQGMASLTAYIHARGLKASIWYAPFLAAPDSWPAREHPEWLLRGVDGTPVTITIAGPTYVLDASNPAVLDYIRAVCARIRDWGFDSVKLDFLYAGSMPGQRYRFDLNPVQAYNAAMATIRDTFEADSRHPIYLVGVQQGLLPSGYFQAWRVGRDIESKTNAGHIPTWDLIRREALAVSAYSFTDGAIYGADPDDLLLRAVPGAQNLTRDELQSYATMVALGGSVWLSGDDLPTLARQGRLGLLTNAAVLALVRAGRAATPVRLSDQASGPASLWEERQPDGSAVIGLFNWSDRARRFTVSFADLGMSPNQPYVVRDLWAGATLLHAARAFTYALRPHQSYLLRISAGI
jgi:hypothetical protein